MMRLTSLLSLLLFLSWTTLDAQHRDKPGQVARNVAALQASGKEFLSIEPFTGTLPLSSVTLPEEVRSEAAILVPDLDVLSKVESEKPDHVDIAIPGLHGANILCRLYRAEVGGKGFLITYSDGRRTDRIEGAFYRGIVAGDPNSVVAISIFKDHIRGFIGTAAGNLILGPLEPGDALHSHILYDDKSIAALNPLTCSTEDDLNHLEDLSPEGKRQARMNSDCVAMYWEVDYDVFQNKGNNTQNWITGLANEVYTLYENDGVTLATNEIKIWVTPSPYNGPSDGQFLTQFRSQYNGNFNGDLGILVNFKGSGGIAYLNGLCNEPNNVSYARIYTTYQGVPTYSWTIQVCAHEIGHNMGSPHTHACFWNGNNTRIDNCGGNAGYPEGNCNSNPPNPPNGGTIMSYCHLAGVGINFNNGFGPQPAELMVDNANGAFCLVGCSGGVPCSIELTCPVNVTVSCDADIAPQSTGDPTYQTAGNCENDPVVTWADDASGLTGCNGTGALLRTFTATEGAFSIACTQTITIVDNTPPDLFYVADDVTIACQESVPDPDHASADNCGDTNLEVLETIQPGSCLNNFTILRTYVVSDECGNSVTASQSITVEDTAQPQFSASNGDSYVYTCAEEIPVIEPEVSDNCGDATLSYRDSVLVSGACPPLLFVRTWTARDQCGNTATFEVFIEKTDTENPIAKCHSLEVLLNSGNPIVLDPAEFDDGSTDDCTSLSFSVEPKVVGCDDLGERNILFVAADACGNRDSCTTTLLIAAPQPKASFTADQTGPLSFSFDASASEGQEYLWDFGDGNQASGMTTDHQYAKGGSYTVTLIMVDTVCQLRDTVTLSVNAETSSLDDLSGDRLKVYPNPGNGLFQLEYRLSPEGTLPVTVIDPLGRPAHQAMASFTNGLAQLDLRHLPSGMYFLTVTTPKTQQPLRLVIR